MTTRSLVPVLLVCLVLAACGDTSQPGAAPDVAETTTTDVPGIPVADPDDADDEDGVDPEEETEPADPAPEDAPDPDDTANDATEADGSPTECILGTWLSDNTLFLAGMQEFGDGIQSVTGEVTVTFAGDGRMTTVYDDWEITGEVDGNRVTIRRDGTDAGSYTVDDETISITETEMGSTTTLSAAGSVMMEIPPEPTDLTGAPFTCSDTELWLTAYEGDHRLERR